jgi:hypothetical protein
VETSREGVEAGKLLGFSVEGATRRDTKKLKATQGHCSETSSGGYRNVPFLLQRVTKMKIVYLKKGSWTTKLHLQNWGRQGSVSFLAHLRQWESMRTESV